MSIDNTHICKEVTYTKYHNIVVTVDPNNPIFYRKIPTM